mgnify:CR=1 FL=1
MEDQIGIVIQARTGSTRMPLKVIQPFHEGKGVLEIIAERVHSTFHETPLAIATSVNEGDDQIEQISSKLGIRCFRGSEANVLDRFIGAANMINAQKVIRICADNPFLDVDSLEKLKVKLESSKADYLSFQFSSGTPSILSHIGLFAEGASTRGLKKAAETTQDPLYTEHVTNYLYNHPKEFKVEWIPVSEEFDQSENIRLTLDTWNDFKLLQKLYSKFTNDFNSDTYKLIKFTKSQKDILDYMGQEIKANSK